MSDLPQISTLAHSVYSPSGAKRWVKCSGSLVLSARLPEPLPSKYALAGTLAHEGGEHILRSDDWASYHKLDAESRSAVKVYVDYVRDVNFKIGGKMNIEYRLQNKSIKDASGDKPAPIFGTADCIIRNDDELYIIDYKHGAGVAVDVVNNHQLILYALMALDTWPTIKQLTLVIVQPRAQHPDGPIREGRFDLDELEYWHQIFQHAIWDVTDAERAADILPYLNAGDHCQWCRAASVCPEIKSKALEQAKVAFDDKVIEPPDPSALDLEQLTRVLDAEPLLLAYLNACKQRAAALLRSGYQVPGRKLVRSYSRRKWSDERKVINALKEMGLLNLEIVTEKLKSPNQIKKALTRTEFDAISQYIERTEKDPVMVLESDGREAVDSKEAVINQFKE
jgi:hypothetical protein